MYSDIEASPRLAFAVDAFTGRGPLLDAVVAAEWSAAPDPLPMLRKAWEANAAVEVAEDGSVPLALTSFNVALLDFGSGVFAKRTPLLAERLPDLLRVVLAEDVDVVALQEVWTREHTAQWVKAADAAGWAAFHGDRGVSTDGLLTLVRKTAMAGLGDVKATAYTHQAVGESDAGVVRGMLSVAFKHASSGLRVEVLNTHVVAWLDQWPGRLAQCVELGRAVAASQADVCLAAGDMNAGLVALSDEWMDKARGAVTGHDVWRGTLAVPALLAAADGDAPGSAILASSVGRTAFDVERTAAVVQRDASGPPAEPLVSYTHRGNWLVIEQYGVDAEPDQQLDHVILRASNRSAKVLSSSLCFTEPFTYGSVTTPLSDHYGVRVHMRIGKA